MSGWKWHVFRTCQLAPIAALALQQHLVLAVAPSAHGLVTWQLPPAVFLSGTDLPPCLFHWHSSGHPKSRSCSPWAQVHPPVLWGSSATLGNFPELGSLLKFGSAFTFLHFYSATGFMLAGELSRMWTTCCAFSSLFIMLLWKLGSSQNSSPSTPTAFWSQPVRICATMVSPSTSLPFGGVPSCIQLCLFLHLGQLWEQGCCCSFSYLILCTETTPNMIPWLLLR